MIKLDELAETVRDKGRLIGAPAALLVIHTRPVGDGTPHIEIDGGRCFYVISERGFEFSREQIESLDGLLYRIFTRVTFHMAVTYELKHRMAQQDSRRLIFSKQLELMGTLSLQWQRRTERRIREILEAAPFVDGV